VWHGCNTWQQTSREKPNRLFREQMPVFVASRLHYVSAIVVAGRALGNDAEVQF
jgi:hypothetical protein